MVSIDFFTVPTAKHLSRILSSYFEYYHHDRTHHGLGKDAPVERPIQPMPVKGGKVIALPRVGGVGYITATSGERLHKRIFFLFTILFPGRPRFPKARFEYRSDVDCTSGSLPNRFE